MYTEEAEIKVSYGVGKRKKYDRKYIHFSGLGRSDVTMSVHNNSEVNLIRALVERVFNVRTEVAGVVTLTPPPIPLRHVYFNNMAVFRRKFLENMRPVTRMGLQQFVDSSPTHKVKIYQEALRVYLERGMTQKDAELAAFVKAEKFHVKASDPIPRVIQPRGVVFNLLFGCFIRPFEKECYKAIDRVFGRETVISGHNAEEVAKILRHNWDTLQDPISFSTDIVKFDQHVSPPALAWEHSVIKPSFKTSPHFKTLVWCLDKQVHNVGHAHTSDEKLRKVKIAYKREGGRASGDMTTSQSNKTTVTGHAYSYFTVYLGFECGVDYTVTNAGDDQVILMSRDAYARYLVMTGESFTLVELALVDPTDWQRVHIAYGQQPATAATHLDMQAWLLTMGFSMKIEAIGMRFEKIEFCQSQPCFIDGRWIMVRGLKALAKDTYSMKSMEYAPTWISQVRRGGLAAYASTPVFSAFYGAMPDNGKEVKDTLLGEWFRHGLYHLSRGMHSETTVSDENRINFYHTFGVTPREQELIEQEYSLLEYGGAMTEINGAATDDSQRVGQDNLVIGRGLLLPLPPII